jgi:predicted HAD superfamily Cof-like phosphohydrolase
MACDHIQNKKARAECLKELADLVYVCFQFAAAAGWELDEALDRVHQSNMSKLVDGKPLKREDGKVLKGPNYKPPYLTDLV